MNARRVRYTDAELLHAAILDLIVDCRCAERDGLHDYAQECRAKALRLFRARHGAFRIDRYGMPKVTP